LVVPDPIDRERRVVAISDLSPARVGSSAYDDLDWKCRTCHVLMGPGRLAIEVVGGSALRAVIESEYAPLIGVEIERGVLVLLVAVPVTAPDHVVPSRHRWAVNRALSREYRPQTRW